MFSYLKRLWDAKKLNEAELRRAVDDKKWITAEEFTEISGIKY